MSITFKDKEIDIYENCHNNISVSVIRQVVSVFQYMYINNRNTCYLYSLKEILVNMICK